MLWHYVRFARAAGGRSVAGKLGRALAAGLVAGIFVAVGARLGMRFVAMANDAIPRISWRGTSAVFAVYIGIGALCGLL